MKQQNVPSLEENIQEKKRHYLPLFIFLLLLTLITSSIAGYILGRNTGTAPLGQVIDTILLEPEETEALKTAFHLTGQVCYSDGTPAAGRTLQLHSDPITTVTDSKGAFLFPNVPQGEHTIYVLDGEGKPAAQRDVHVMREDTAGAVSIGLMEGGEYVIELAIDVRVLEITIELGKGEIYINPEQYSYATQGGTVVTPDGSASLRDGVVVTPGGNVYLPDGNIILPGGSKADPTYIIQSDDTVVMNQPLIGDDIKVAQDGTVTLPDNTVIEPGGTIILPDGTAKMPGSGGVIVGEGAVTPIGGSTNDTTAENTSPNTPANQISSSPLPVIPEPEEDSNMEIPVQGGNEESSPGHMDNGGNNPPYDTPAVGGGNGKGSNEDGGNQGGNGDVNEPADTDVGVLQVSGQDRDGIFVGWEQDCTIDLFYNRITGRGEKIAPGSSGYYLFQLQNTRKEKLTITLKLSEALDSSHLPLYFMLSPQKESGKEVSGILSQTEGLILQTVIEGGETAVYQLNWEWPYDGGKDAVDTAAGDKGGSYNLKLAIRAEGGG